MIETRRVARVNVRALVILLVVVCVLVVGAIVGHGVRKDMIASRALEAANQAAAQKTWPEACNQLKLYLSKRPDDLVRLRTYADWNLNVSPPDPERLSAAIGAYRKLLRKQPDNVDVFRNLTRLYMSVGNATEAGYVCRQRLETDPTNTFAMLWLARAQVLDRKPREAVETLERLVKVDPKEVAAYTMLAALSLETDTPQSREQALQWSDRAVETNTGSADAFAHRARVRRIVNGITPEGRAAALEDLRAAQEAAVGDPAIGLLIADEWMTWGQIERARTVLAQTPDMDPTQAEKSEIEPATFALLKFSGQGNVALRSNDTSGCAHVADRALKELTDHRRTLFLPLAARLYMAASKLDEARNVLSDYEQNLPKQDDKSGERLAILKAMLALVEDKPYQAIESLLNAGSGSFQDAEAWRLLADGYMQTGQEGLAIDALRRYVEKIPYDQSALSKLARLYRGRDWNRVLALAQMSQKLSPQPAMRLLEVEAQLALAGPGGDANEVREKSRKALVELRDAGPQNVGPRLLLADLRAAHGDVDGAEAELREAIETCADKLTPALKLAELYQSHGRMNEAIEVCKSAIHRQASMAAPYIQLSQMYQMAEKADLARATLVDAAGALSRDQRRAVQQALARLLISQNKQDEAVSLLTALAAERSDDVPTRLLLASLPTVRADRTKMDGLLEEIRRAEGEHGVRWKFQRAMHWMDGPDWQAHHQAIEELLADCARAQPEWDAPALALGVLYERGDDLAQAEEHYRDALARNAGSTEAISRLSKVLERRGRFAEARQLLDSAGGENAALANRRLSLSLSQQHFDEAISELEARRNSGAATAVESTLLAELYYKHRKDRSGAEAVLHDLAATDSLNPAYLRLRATMLQDEGKVEEAVAMHNDAVSKRPDFEHFRLRGEFLSGVGRASEAERDFKQLVTLSTQSEAGYVALGSFYESQKRSADALSTWDEANKAFSNSMSVRRGLMRALLSQSDPAKQAQGRELLASLRAEYPTDAELAQISAELSLAQRTPESLDEALRALEKAVEADPSDVKSHLRRAALLRERGQIDNARTALSVAVQANPASAELRMAQIDLELDGGNHAIARGLAQTLIDEKAADSTLAIQLAGLFLIVNYVDTAQVFNQKALAADVTGEAANVQRADILSARGLKQAAIDHLARFVGTENGRTSVTAVLRLANLQMSAGNFGEADRLLTQAEGFAPGQIRVLVERLRLLAVQKRFAEFDGLVSQSRAESGEDDFAMLISAARILLDAGGEAPVRQARALFSEAAAQSPRQVAGFLGVAQASQRLGDIEAAIKAYRDILSFSPQHAQSLNDLAWLLSNDRGEEALKEASELATKGLRSYPGDIHLLDTRGAALIKQARWSEARADLEKCVALSEANPSTQAHALLKLARVLKELHASLDHRRSLVERVQILDRERRVLSEAERSELEDLSRD